jgi:hypothetical protein
MSGQRDLRRLGPPVGDGTLIATSSPGVRPDERRERERERQAGTVWDADRQ